MLENKLIISFIGFVLVFAFLPSLEAKVYWINNYPEAKQHFGDVPKISQPLGHREQEKPDPIELVFNVIKQLIASRQKSKKHSNDVESVEHKCASLFGSIHGTKQQKLQCLENLKKERQTDKYLKHTNEMYDKHFTDLTRAEDISDANIRTDIFYNPDFSTDYMDFKNLRANDEELEFADDLRKSNKEMDYIQHQRTLYTSDSESDQSVEVKKTNKKYSKKPKRFQIIDNDQSEEKVRGSSSSSDETGDSSDEYKPAKPNKKDINLNNEHYLQGNYDSSDLEKPVKVSKKKEHYLQGNDDFSEDEFEEPVKTNKKKTINKSKKSNQKKEFYLQGGRLISTSSVEDGRRRLPHFLPKRFHWSEEEIQNLGYYWFNGPQGEKAYFPKRP